MRRSLLCLLALALVLQGGLTACFRALNPLDFPTSTALFEAGRRAYEREKWGNAINAFERLTLDLPTRDSLLPPSHWYLGKARMGNGERLLAAQAFIRLAESFPQDSLADDALFLSGRAYAQMWRSPSLDPQYGLLAQTQFRLLQAVYPQSPWADSAAVALKRLDEWFATKDYDTGMHYIRRKAYDSAIIYLRDVVTNWPDTDRARQAMLRLVEVYRLPVMRYEADAAEVCATLRSAYPSDPEVLRLCKSDAADGAAVPSAPR